MQDDFAEHSSLIAGLKVDWGVAKHQSWPLPATIPWGKIQVAEWKEAAQPRCQDSPDATQWLQRFSKDFESSLDGYVMGVPGGQLPAQCHGRAQRLKPSVQADVATCPKPCRAGEEPLRHGLLCLEVKQWYRQLRRLQSLLHALRGGKQSPEAMTYRLDLWRAILCSTGFHGGFLAWFPNRLVKHQGMPPFLSPQLPSVAFAERLFDDFRANFRRFEHWHAPSVAAFFEPSTRRIEISSFEILRMFLQILLKQLSSTKPTQLLLWTRSPEKFCWMNFPSQGGYPSGQLTAFRLRLSPKAPHC